MKAAMCIFLLCLLPGCAGILTGEAEAPAPVTVGYNVNLVVTEGGCNSAVGETAGLADIGTNTKDAVFGLTAWASKLPLIGWMFAASKVSDIAGTMGGGNTGDSPVTPAVLATLARTGAKFTYSRTVVWKDKQ